MKETEHGNEAGGRRLAKDPRRARPLLLPERTMYRDGRTPFTSIFPVKLLGEIDESRLRQALARVQKKHPLLRCVINVTAGRPCFVLQEEPAPISLRIVERGGGDDWQTEVRKEWVTPFDASLEPLVRLVWLRGEKVHELILVGHHCICDGIAGINLLRECLSTYDQPDHDLGGYDALGGVADIVPAALLAEPTFPIPRTVEDRCTQTGSFAEAAQQTQAVRLPRRSRANVLPSLAYRGGDGTGIDRAVPCGERHRACCREHGLYAGVSRCARGPITQQDLRDGECAQVLTRDSFRCDVRNRA